MCILERQGRVFRQDGEHEGANCLINNFVKMSKFRSTDIDSVSV